ncbi:MULTISPECIES: hypothetical protein [unclassified Vibrio]|uniref:Uncharacterized protein n=1 Tax=Vibrio sp. HB236076 TaxID=3232307 RepID=A0AB39HHM1_9VIBR|nr:hypothetical protein [Vibrio sp. HB161653]MDP5253188.1 hypothetical protein [Vibrio sp. HB161653]
MVKHITAALLAVSFIAAPVMAAEQNTTKQPQSQQQGKPADYIKIVGVSENNKQR